MESFSYFSRRSDFGETLSFSPRKFIIQREDCGAGQAGPIRPIRQRLAMEFEKLEMGDAEGAVLLPGKRRATFATVRANDQQVVAVNRHREDQNPSDHQTPLVIRREG